MPNSGNIATISGNLVTNSGIDLSTKADLVNGLIPSGQLPSYVDDVLEYANLAGLPGTGETAKIYVTLDNNKIYRWSGSTYIEISPSPGSTDSVAEGSTNLYFTDARARAAISLTTTGTSGAATYTNGVINIPQYQSVLTNPVTGSGTTNYLPKFTGATTLGNSQVFDNGTNVGIGTSSPGSKLDVYKSVGWNPIYTTSNTIYAGIVADSAASGLDIHWKSGNPLRFSTSTAKDGTGYSEKMRIDSNGSVGIGTTSPQSNVDILGSSSRLRLDGSAGSFQILSRNTANTSTNPLIFDADTYTYNRGGVTQMTLTANGRLLLGTTTEGTQRLQVVGTSYFSDSVGIGTTSPTAALQIYSGLKLNQNGTLQWGSSGGQGILTWDTGKVIVKGSSGNELHLGANNSNSNIVINSAGSVGIGTTTPVGKLNINTGTTGIDINVVNQANGTISFGNGSGGTAVPNIIGKSINNVGLIINSAVPNVPASGYDMGFNVVETDNTDFATLTSSAYRFFRAGNPLMTIERNGSVGIGTSSPQAKLHIAQSSSAVLFQQDGTAATIVGTNAAGTASQGLFLRGFPLTFTGNGGGAAEQMRLDASGNLGLGVVPSAWNIGLRVLEIGGPENGYIAFNPTNLQSYIYWNAYYDTDNRYKKSSQNAAAFGFTSSGSYAWYNAPSGTAGNAITFTQAMTLDASGRLGIGTTSPIAKLHIYGTGGTNDIYSIVESNSHAGTRIVAAAFTYAFNQLFQGGSGMWEFGSDNSYNFYIRNATNAGSTSSQFYINRISGNVGINTTAPSTKFEINTPTYATFTGTSSVARFNALAGTGAATALLLTNYVGDLSTDTTVDLDFAALDGNSVIGAVPHARIGYTGAYNDGINTDPGLEARGYFRIATRGEGSGGVLSDRLLIDHTGKVRFLNYTSAAAFTGTVVASLAVDSSGNIITTAPGGVSGTGTANYVTKWSDADTIANSIIFDNGTNVGIGTTNSLAYFDGALATRALQIVGNGRTGINLQDSSAVNQYLNIGVNGGAAFIEAVYSTAPIINYNAYSAHIFITGSTPSEKMRITSSGNVGIGTASPSLHTSTTGLVVRGSARGIIELWDATSGKSVFQNVSGDTYIGQLDKGTGVGRLYLLVNGNGSSADIAVTFAANSAATFASSVTASSLIKSGGTSSQYLMADGSTSTLTNPVTGTGTTNYLPKFTGASTLGNSILREGTDVISLGIAPSAWSILKAFQIQRSALSSYTDSGFSSTQLSANTYYDGSWRYIGNHGAAKYDQQSNNQAHFWSTAPAGTAGNAITFTQAMTLFNTGNLALNSTTDTGQRLQVTGDGSFTGQVNSAFFYTTATSSPSGQEGLRIANNNGYIGFFNGGNSTRSAYIQGNTTDLTINTSLAIPIRFGTSNVEKMRLDASGNLGLGVVPSAWGSAFKAMQIADGGAVWGSTNVTEVSIGGNTRVDVNNAQYDYISNGLATRYQQVTGTHRWFIAPSGTAGAAITFTQAMTLTANGRLLLGSTSDTGELLQVNGTMKVTGASTFGGNVDVVTSTNAVLTLDALSTNTSALIFKGSGTERGRISFSNSNNIVFSIGSGVTQYLNVDATTRAATFSSSVTAGLIGGTTTVRVSHNEVAAFNSGTAATLYLNYGGGNVITNGLGGNLLVGTTTDTGEKLQVNGTMKVTGASTFSTSVNVSSGSAPTGIFLNSGVSQLTRFQRGTSVTILSDNYNAFSPASQDNTTIPSWQIRFGGGSGADLFRIERSPAGSTTMANLFNIDGTGAATFSSSVTAASATITGNLTVTGTITEQSALRYKENIAPLTAALDKVDQLQPITYNKKGSSTKEIGLIAEDVFNIYPEFVLCDDSGDPVGIHYSRLTAVLIESIKELKKEINELKNRN